MDEQYDVIVCGTGLKECILSGLFSVALLRPNIEMIVFLPFSAMGRRSSIWIVMDTMVVIAPHSISPLYGTSSGQVMVVV